MHNSSTTSKTIMGIDPGTYITGYGVINKASNRGERVQDYGCIRPPRQASFSERYLIIYKSLSTLLEKHQPDELAVETQFVRKNVQSAMKLGMVRGIVILSAALYEIPVFEYTPAKVKLAVVGNGQASKSQVQKMVKHILKMSEIPKPEDAADALAIALSHSQSSQYQQLQGCKL
ncbi:MAG: crossover junction endodeoxyribonuclease RuvC [Chlamydiota bacterium]